MWSPIPLKCGTLSETPAKDQVRGDRQHPAVVSACLLRSPVQVAMSLRSIRLMAAHPVTSAPARSRK